MTTEPESDGGQDSSGSGSDDDEKANDPLTQSDEGEKAPNVEWGENPAGGRLKRAAGPQARAATRPATMLTRSA